MVPEQVRIAANVLNGSVCPVAVVATLHMRAMQGGAQGHLMLGADEQLYVVKFQNNPQATRVLANEYLATRLAQAVGLSVPACELVEVTPWLIERTPELSIKWAHTTEPCKPGMHFGSRFVGGLMPGKIAEYLAEDQLLEVQNLNEFAGMLVLDKWVCNVNGRQTVYVRTGKSKRYRAIFIDHGYAFNAGEWVFRDVALRGVFPRNSVYEHVTGWESFEPWLSRVEGLEEGVVWRIAEDIPVEWHGGDVTELERLVEQLLERRSKVRELIEAFRDSDRKPFPKWGQMPGGSGQ